MAFLRAAVAVILLASVCAAATPTTTFPTAWQALESNKNLTLFTKLAWMSGLRPYLKASVTRATIFAPTDAAITQLAAAFKQTPKQLTQDFNQLLVDRIVGYHIVLEGGNLKSSSLKNAQVLTTAGGGNITVAQATSRSIPPKPVGPVTLKGVQNSAKVVSADLIGGNVTIHVIDSVLLPATVFTSLKAALDFSPKTSTLKSLILKDATLSKAAADPTTNVTVFAPINSAFEAISSSPALKDAAKVSKILSYHVVKGATIQPDFKGKGPFSLPTLLEGQNVTLTKVPIAVATVLTRSNATVEQVNEVQVTADSKGAKGIPIKKYNIIAGASTINVITGVLIPKL